MGFYSAAVAGPRRPPPRRRGAPPRPARCPRRQADLEPLVRGPVAATGLDSCCSRRRRAPSGCRAPPTRPRRTGATVRYAVRLGLDSVRGIGTRGGRADRGGARRSGRSPTRSTCPGGPASTPAQLEALATAGVFDGAGASTAGRRCGTPAGPRRAEHLEGLHGRRGRRRCCPSMERRRDHHGRPVGHRDHARAAPVRAPARRAAPRPGSSRSPTLATAESGRRVHVARAGHAPAAARAPPVGVTFLNLEDETGMLNVICTVGVWRRYRQVARNRVAMVIRGHPRAPRRRHQPARRPGRGHRRRRARRRRGAPGPCVVARLPVTSGRRTTGGGRRGVGRGHAGRPYARLRAAHPGVVDDEQHRERGTVSADPADFTYSVVVPVFNSEDVVGRTIDRIVEVFEDAGLRYELILVNDGSRDGSWDVIAEPGARQPARRRAQPAAATTASTTPTSPASARRPATTSSPWTTTCRTRPTRRCC